MSYTSNLQELPPEW